MKKDVIYIDADDEISVVANEITQSKEKVVALVLPKRCTILHSAVNMKILNKAAQGANKRVVLISAEKALLPIAGAAGVYVAKNLQSKPEIPAITTGTSETEEVAVDDVDLNPTTPVGDLAEDDDAIELDNAPNDTEPPKKEKKDKKLMVPNFDTFRKKLFLIIAIIVVLIISIVYALIALPKATITIRTSQTNIPILTDLTANPTYEDNITEKKLQLSTKTIDKAQSKKGQATGEKDNGTKASGTVYFVNCSISDKLGDVVRTVPAGTGISSGEYTFITQEPVTISPSGFQGTTCKEDKPSNTINVVAQNGGDKYNLSARSYSVAGFGTITAVDEDGMGGGTSDIITIVSANDCNALTDQLIADSNKTDTKQTLLNEFKEGGLLIVDDTFRVETVSTTCEPGVNKEAKEFTVKATFRYTVSGVSVEGINTIITNEALEVAGQGQSIIDTGISSATLGLTSREGETVTLSLKATAISGVVQDEERVKEIAAGNNARETADTLKDINGVEDVEINYSPFWVTKTPKNYDKITVEFIVNDN